MTGLELKDCILIVDDDSDYRDILSQWIERALNVEIVAVENGVAALNYLRSHGRPALVLTDLRMPLMGGLALIDEMLKDKVLKATPVILLTGDDFTASWKENLVAVLKKPCTRHDLLRIIRSVLI
jgi:putative two-component system response regulator